MRSIIVYGIRELAQQDGWKIQDGRITKKCRARLCIPNLRRHFCFIQPSCCISSLLPIFGRDYARGSGNPTCSLYYLEPIRSVVVIRPDVIGRLSRTTEDSSCGQILRLVPVFTLETNNQTNNECLPKFIQTHNASSSVKTANVN